MHAHLAHKLLAQKVADLDEGAALADGAVDGEMGVDGAHLVLVALNEVYTRRYAARIKRSLAAIALSIVTLFEITSSLSYYASPHSDMIQYVKFWISEPYLMGMFSVHSKFINPEKALHKLY